MDEQEGVGHALIASGACLHSRLSQPSRIQFALVPERIELRRNHQGRRETGEVIRQQGRGKRTPAVGRIRQVHVSCELVRRPTNEVALSEPFVGFRLHFREVQYRVDQQLKGDRRPGQVACLERYGCRQVSTYLTRLRVMAVPNG